MNIPDVPIGNTADLYCYSIKAIKGNKNRKTDDCNKCALEETGYCQMFLCDKRERKDNQNVYFIRI